ncbi:hypothetical protein FKM82_020973 [Ascaphus truei]
MNRGWEGKRNAACQRKTRKAIFKLYNSHYFSSFASFFLFPLPVGKLIISADKDTYEELGLQGKPSLYSGKKAMRYKATSIVSYFSKYKVKACHSKITSSILRDLHCPVLKSGELHGQPEESCSSEELFEWLGAVSNNIDCNNSSSSFISTYCCPHPNTIVGQANLCTITGFIIPEKIQQLLQQLREYFDEPKLTQWVSLMVHGFADSPVSWSENEHGFHKGGENLYSFVIFNNEDYWLHKAVGTNDGCPP